MQYLSLIQENKKDIIELEENIYKIWLPSTNYNLGNLPNIEYYEDDFCYIYIAIS